MLRIRSSLVLIFCVLSAPAWAAMVIVGQARVVDGDTLEVNGQTLRLFGIDAPEHNQNCDRNGLSWECGVWSEAMLVDIIAARQVRCAAQETDRYGRLLAQCEVGGKDLGTVLVRAGAASAYLRYSLIYKSDQAFAQESGAGIWAGRMVTPEKYRHPDRPDPSAENFACPIKGNISKGGRIYHVPGQRDYAATQINPSRGESWFCSSAEAEAAGFRPARR